MNNIPSPIKDELERLFSFREAFNNVQLYKNELLPPGTMIVSSDIFELLKQLPSGIK